MSLADIGEKIAGIFTTIATLKRQFEEQAKLLEKQGAEISALRKENAELTTRVAVLEEARKTTAAEVKVAVTESLVTWERQKMREEREEFKRRLPPSDDAD